MNRCIGALALLALPLAACETTAPEDYNRRIHLSWNLAPSDATLIKRTVEAGDIILTWTAQAKATHEMTLAGGNVALVAARTTYGQVYCTTKNCYEDRDGDGAFDYMWDIYRSGIAPNDANTVTNAQALKAPVAFRAAAAAGPTIFEQLLGLVYAGPLEGVPKEDQSLLPMIGEFAVGWYGGEKIARTPDGVGWSEQQSIPLIIADGFTPSTTVSPLGLTYKPLRATIDGMLEVELQAKTVEGIDLSAKQKFDVGDPAATPPVATAAPVT